MSTQHRLEATRLSQAALPAVRGARVPAYARQALKPGIVHLGIGAFMRAHLAAVNEDTIEASGELDHGIVGVSLRQPDTRDALQPQDGLYTLALRDADESGRPRQSARIIGCVLRVIVATESPREVLDAIADAHTRIVSLTVTEKGYCHDPATGRLRLDHPDIVHDLAPACPQSRAPRTAIGFLVHGLARRMAGGHGGITLLSLDNLPSNGHVFRAAVTEFAAHRDAALADWIAQQCSFPVSMVDRIVPRTTDEDRESIARAIGMHDAWPVVGEPFLDWAIEDDFVAGRPDWTKGGARFVDDASGWERLKLRMVNGAHSSIAYLGAMAGWQTVDQAIARPALRAHVLALMRDEIEPTLSALPGLELAHYRERLVARFANPALAHRTHQIAMDGSQKLPQRLLGTIRDRLASDAPCPRLVLGVAAWLHYLRGQDEAGHAYRVDDPLSAELEALRRLADGQASALERARCWLGYRPVFGELGGNEAFVRALASSLESLRERGVLNTLESM